MHNLTGQLAPNFSLPDQDNKLHSLADYKGRWLILYFYPKDMTPGCTLEACSFRDNTELLTKEGVAVLGVSADTVKSHGKFAQTFKLSFPLLADIDNTVSKLYESYGKKKFMGREYNGILRNTYVINPEGVIVRVYESVKPKAHVDQILEDLKSRWA